MSQYKWCEKRGQFIHMKVCEERMACGAVERKKCERAATDKERAIEHKRET